jgi:hypothetical protein
MMHLLSADTSTYSSSLSYLKGEIVLLLRQFRGDVCTYRSIEVMIKLCR